MGTYIRISRNDKTDEDGQLSLPAHCPIDCKKDLGGTFPKLRETHLQNLTHLARQARHTSSPRSMKNSSRASPMTVWQQTLSQACPVPLTGLLGWGRRGESLGAFLQLWDI